MKPTHLESLMILFDQYFTTNPSGFGFRFSVLNKDHACRTLITGDDKAHFGAIRYEDDSRAGLYVAHGNDDSEELNPETIEWVIQFAKHKDIDDMISALNEVKSILPEDQS